MPRCHSLGDEALFRRISPAKKSTSTKRREEKHKKSTSTRKEEKKAMWCGVGHAQHSPYLNRSKYVNDTMSDSSSTLESLLLISRCHGSRSIFRLSIIIGEISMEWNTLRGDFSRIFKLHGPNDDERRIVEWSISARIIFFLRMESINARETFASDVQKTEALLRRFRWFCATLPWSMKQQLDGTKRGKQHTFCYQFTPTTLSVFFDSIRMLVYLYGLYLYVLYFCVFLRNCAYRQVYRTYSSEICCVPSLSLTDDDTCELDSNFYF